MAALDLAIPVFLAVLAVGALAGVSMGVFFGARSLLRGAAGRKSS